MHAVMMTSRPALFYWLPPTLAVIHRIHGLREDGVDVCYTMDAGANVHCICTKKYVDTVREELRSISGVKDILYATPGGAASS